jgi:hypothetical protein
MSAIVEIDTGKQNSLLGRLQSICCVAW